MKEFIISDLHLNHKNIIKYTNRPFRNVAHMNREIIKRWNDIVDKKDRVYFLGDLAFGKHKLSWLDRLNGEIIIVKGNHDNVMWDGVFEMEININGENILLVHSPHTLARSFPGWIIHGHFHHHQKLIDCKKKRINVSCENLNYTPIELMELLRKRS